MNRCWWGFHSWGKWKTYAWDDCTSQARVCMLCDFEEHRDIRGAWGATYKDGAPADKDCKCEPILPSPSAAPDKDLSSDP